MSDQIEIEEVTAIELVIGEQIEVDIGAGVPGAQGPAGAAGATGATGPAGPSGGSYTHVQNTPASTWNITHSLGYRPAVTVLDSGGTAVEGDVQYPTVSTVTITFSSAFSGEATLS